MKTQQIMIRDLMGQQVRQQHLTNFFCINDMTHAGNIYRKDKGLAPAKWVNYVNTDKTKEFFNVIKKEENIIEIIKTQRGKGGLTWAHPFVFFDYGFWISPDFKYKLYTWLEDNLLVFRDKSGDSYKKVAASMMRCYNMKPSLLGLELPAIARDIKLYLKVEDWNLASPEQLQKRDDIHEKIALLMEVQAPLKKIKELVLPGFYCAVQQQ